MTAMDELEMRVTAIELALIEVFAWIDPAALEDATASLRASLPNCDPDDRAVRLDALRLIEDGQRRFRGHRGG